jgi:surface protein
MNQLLIAWAGTNGVSLSDNGGYMYFNNNPTMIQKFMDDLRWPLAGLRYWGSVSDVRYQDAHGYYWSSSPNGEKSRRLFFDSDSSSVNADNNSSYRAYGLSVRCFKNPEPQTGNIIPFITTWELPTNKQIILPVVAAGAGYDFDIARGDGTTGHYTTANLPARNSLNHTYGSSFASGDMVQITIKGNFPRLYCNNQAICQQLRSVDQWGDTPWSSMNAAFYGANNLTINATDTPNLTNVVDVSSMFRGVVNLTGNFSGWDTSRVNNFYLMFYAATNFSQDLDSWKVSSATNMQQMFDGATNFNGSLSGRYWTTTGVNLSYFLRNATKFNQPLHSWNTSGIANLRSTFQNAVAFNQDLSSWDTSQVTMFIDTFNGASAFNQDLSSRSITGLTTANSMTNILNGTNLSNSHYNAALIARANQLSGLATVQNPTAIPAQYGGCNVANATQGIADRATLVASGWTITDGGQALDCSRPFITTWELTGGDLTLTLPLPASTAYNFIIDWGDYDGATTGDKNVQTFNATTPTVSHTYLTGGTKTVSIMGNFPRLYCNTDTQCLKLRSVEQRGDTPWTNMLYAFR